MAWMDGMDGDLAGERELLLSLGRMERILWIQTTEVSCLQAVTGPFPVAPVCQRMGAKSIIHTLLIMPGRRRY